MNLMKANASLIHDALKAFLFEGEPLSCVPYGNGHINETFLVEGKNRYILQRLNRSVFPHSKRTMDNLVSVLPLEISGGFPFALLPFPIATFSLSPTGSTGAFLIGRSLYSFLGFRKRGRFLRKGKTPRSYDLPHPHILVYCGAGLLIIGQGLSL